MAYVEIRKDGKLITQRLVADQETQKGCNVRLGEEGAVRLYIGESKQIGKYHVAMYDGQPSEDGFKAVEDLEKAANSIPPVDDKKAGSAPQENARSRRPQIDNIEITGRLGEGGMGTVWRGIQLSTKREVAIKFLGGHRFTTKKMQARFEREVALAAKLNHPNIASVYDSGVHRGVYYYVMELIDGTHLDKYVYKNELNDHQIVLLMDEICDAMRHAHEKGIIHRDLKPSNILVSKEGKPYIVDFGLAKATQKEEDDVTISISGDIAGTPAYMAPEQAAGKISEIGPYSDVYALGIIFYRLVTGQYPHKVYGSRYDVLKSIIEDEIAPPRSHKPDIDRDLESVIMKALAKKSEDRYADAGQMTEDIESLLSGKPLAAKSMSSVYMLQKRMNKLRKPAFLAAMSILIMTIIFFTAYHFGKHGISAQSAANARDEIAINHVADLSKEQQVMTLNNNSAAIDKQPPSQTIQEQKTTLPITNSQTINAQSRNQEPNIKWVQINDPGVSGHESFNGYMSKYETTNAQYCQYLNAALASNDITVRGSTVVGASGPYSGQVYYDLAGAGRTHNGATNGGAARINWTGNSFTVDSGFENHPATYVSWYGSTAFASYYGWRLPTAWEWQAVADFNSSYTYGCGTSINNSIANYAGSTHPDGTTAVGAFGTYGYGMCDMAGNVREWTSTSTVNESSRVIRGGCWFNIGHKCTVSYRPHSYPDLTYYDLGFRVCR